MKCAWSRRGWGRIDSLEHREVLRFLGEPGLKFRPDDATKNIIERL